MEAERRTAGLYLDNVEEMETMRICSLIFRAAALLLFTY